MNKHLKKFLVVSLALGGLFYGQSLAMAATEDVSVTKYVVDASKYQIPYSGNEPEFNHKINPGYGSAIVLKGIDKKGNIEFYAITDRGPNADIPTYRNHDGKVVPGKFFPTPNFTPSIGVIKVEPSKDKAEIVKSIPLKVDGKKITGKVVPSGSVGSTGEVALDFKMQDLGSDPNGLDTEGITLDKDGNFWISDEYGPFIVKANKHGEILEKFAPGKGLPSILASRVPNRGSEGLTIDDNGNIVALIQSPLDVNGKTAKTAKYTRLVKLNPTTKQVTMYAYSVDTGYKNFGAAKLGDITSIGNNQFLIIEQGKQHGKMQNLVYKIDLTGATEIPDNGDLEEGKLKNVVPVKKELVLDLRKNGWNIEKAEGLALLPDRQTIAVVNDNDFGIAIKVTDPQAVDPKVEDYTYDANMQRFSYKKDPVAHEHVTMGLEQNAPTEQQSQIWFFKLPNKL